MPENTEQWLKRAEEFRLNDWRGDGAHSSEALMFALSITSSFYGLDSPQLDILKKRSATDKQDYWDVYQIASGAIANAVAEIRAGLITKIRLNITGEVLADLTIMAQDALAEGRIQVASVLTAAAFEDLMRRLAYEKAGVISRPKLETVLHELKDKGVLLGGEPALANGFLKFRNDSLHADWPNVTEPQIGSCLSLINSLILKHLS